MHHRSGKRSGGRGAGGVTNLEPLRRFLHGQRWGGKEVGGTWEGEVGRGQVWPHRAGCTFSEFITYTGQFEARLVGDAEFSLDRNHLRCFGASRCIISPALWLFSLPMMLHVNHQPRVPWSFSASFGSKVLTGSMITSS